MTKCTATKWMKNGWPSRLKWLPSAEDKKFDQYKENVEQLAVKG